MGDDALKMPRQVLLAALLATGCTPHSSPALVPAFGLDRVSLSTASVPVSPARTERPPAAPSAAPPSASPPSSGSGGGGSAGYRGVVLDESENPIAGATVTLPDGRSTPTNASGAFSFSGGAGGAVEVAAPGFATTRIEGDAPTAIHLRRSDNTSSWVDAGGFTVTGRVSWAPGDTEAGYVFYYDTYDGLVDETIEASGSTYVFDVAQHRPGRPTAIVLVASTRDDALRVGISRAFAPTAGETPAPIGVAPVTMSPPVTLPPPPAPDGHVACRAEYVEADLAVPLDEFEGPTGAFRLPALDGHPGTLRAIARMWTPDGLTEGRMSFELAQGPEPWLAPPAPAVDLAELTVSWPTVPEAKGYRLEAGPVGAPPRWEAWTTGTTIALPQADWLRPGVAQIRLEAVDGEVPTRRIASARALRLAPWTSDARWRTSSRLVLL